jgi:hypothetical protein
MNRHRRAIIHHPLRVLSTPELSSVIKSVCVLAKPQPAGVSTSAKCTTARALCAAISSTGASWQTCMKASTKAVPTKCCSDASAASSGASALSASATGIKHARGEDARGDALLEAPRCSSSACSDDAPSMPAQLNE